MESTCVLSWKIDGRLSRHPIAGSSAVLGREAQCDIRIDRDTISRRHALFRRDGGTWYVSDLGARNGVYVNGEKIEKHRLDDGDRVTVGTLELVCGLTRGAPSNARIELEEDHPDESIARSIRMDDLAARLSSDTGSFARPKTEMPTTAEPIPLPAGMPLLDMFQTASETLLSGTDLNTMLDRVLELIFRSLPKVERGFVCLLEDGVLVPRASRSAFPSGNVQRMRLSQSVADSAIEQREAVLVQDTRLDERFNTAESIVALRIRSVMCAPLTKDETVQGIVYVDTAAPGNPFTEEDLALLSTLSMLSAVAVEQTGLRQQMQRERDQRKELEKILPPHIVDQIVEGEVEAAEVMRTREAEITIFFADIVGFTTLSEQFSASEITEFLNLIFERLTEVVFEHGGTIDKYNGDEIVAFFGAPKSQEDHADRAVRACLGMQAAVDDLNQERGEDAHPIRMRIGVNSGAVTVGGIGHPRRLDYTAIGDVVNTAKRLESTACTPGEVVIGPNTHERIEGRFLCEEMPEFDLKGKEVAVAPYRVISAIGSTSEKKAEAADAAETD